MAESQRDNMGGGAPCHDEADCSLAGKCVKGFCVCDIAWIGSSCQRLNVLRASSDSRFQEHASFGASLLESEDPWFENESQQSTRQFHLFAISISKGCSVSQLPSNSELICAASEQPDGNFYFV